MKKELIKINGINSAELLNDAQLDNISGGTWDEYWEIRKAACRDKKYNKYAFHIDGEDDATDYLRGELGIEANLNGSFLDALNPFKTSEPATYKEISTGKRLAHSQVLRMIRLRTGADR